MPSLPNLTKYFLAAAALTYLGFSGLSAEFSSLQIGDSSATNETSHRGSGRIISLETQAVNPREAIAYRGTGRLESNFETIVSQRGSGRIDDETQISKTIAYRGSGRVLPNNLGLSELV